MGLTLDDLGFVSHNPSSVGHQGYSHENLRLAGRKAALSGFCGLQFGLCLATCLRDNFPYLETFYNKSFVKGEPVFEGR